MPRAKVDLGENWEKQISERLKPAIATLLAEDALFQQDLFRRGLKNAGISSVVNEDLVKSLVAEYEINYGKKLSTRTANFAVAKSLKSAFETAVFELGEQGKLLSSKKIVLGAQNYGSIFYTAATFSHLKEKFVAILEKTPSSRDYLVYKRVKSNGYIKLDDIPYNGRIKRKIVDFLCFFDICHENNGFLCMEGVEPTTDGVVGPLATAVFPKSYVVWKSFKFDIWKIGSTGPKKVKLAFSYVAFDPVAKILHLADESPREVSTGELKKLRIKALGLGLAAHLHYVAPSFTLGAQKYADTWGIFLTETTKPQE